MKKFLGLCVALCLWGSLALAFSPGEDVKILDKKEVAALADDQLIEDYLDVLVEMEAVKVFYNSSGLTPKDYKKYKDLIKYRLLLLLEIDGRKLELPAGLK